MTLILAYISPEFVALASDRRITWTQGGKVLRREDTENKQIFLCGHFLMGYTGLARLEGVPTERWVLDRLSGVDPQDYFGVLQRELRRVLALQRPLAGHAFMAVGYGSTRAAPGALAAVAITASNASTREYGGWQPQADVGLTRTRPLAGPADFRIGGIGIVPKREDLEQAVDWIRRYRKRDKTKAVGVLQILVRLIRQVAESDPGVGKDISLSVMPISAVGQLVVANSLLPVADPITETTCLLIPGDRELKQADFYGPAMICPDIQMWGTEVWYGRKPPWWRDDS